MDYYSAIKKNKIMSFAGKWMVLEIIMLRKINPSSKGQIYVLGHLWILDLK
jgi:hypothetical protein